MLHRWRAVGNTVSDLTGPRFEPQTPAPETNALQLDQLAGQLVSGVGDLRFKSRANQIEHSVAKG